MKKVCIIGGGLGGLSAALRLSANPNYQITILEKEAQLGGKLKPFSQAGFSFDSGPSTLTYIESFEDAFHYAGKNIHDYLSFYKIDPLQRHFFSDGTWLDLTANSKQMQEQIATYSAHDAKNYPQFIAKIKKLLIYAERSFFEKTFISATDILDWRLLADFIKVRPLEHMDKLIKRYFRHPHTIHLFWRYATYVGGRPEQTPAVFNLMAALETGKGIYGIKGGNYQLVEAFRQALLEQNVTIRCQTEVKAVEQREQKQKVLQTSDGEVEADIVIVNQDILSFQPESAKKVEPSLSGFQLMLSVDKCYSMLQHHTIFYPQNYQQEFQQLFDQRMPIDEPAIYICNSAQSDAAMAPTGGSNLFVLVNAPALTKQVDWEEIKADYAAKLINQLENRGLSELSRRIVHQKIVTPLDLEKSTYAYRGAIYGSSSNSIRQSFFRQRGKLAGNNIWAVGGSIQPGGGTPMVVLGGRKIAEQILQTN